MSEMGAQKGCRRGFLASRRRQRSRPQVLRRARLPRSLRIPSERVLGHFQNPPAWSLKRECGKAESTLLLRAPSGRPESVGMGCVAPVSTLGSRGVDCPTYECIGRGYSRHRAADARIVRELIRLLGLQKGGAIVDVGAGTGNYSVALARLGYTITAVEPSMTMRKQAEDVPGVRWVAATAKRLPLPDGCADGAICVLALHHFSDVKAALSEMRRVTGRGSIVVLTFDPRAAEPFWFADYFPNLWHEAYEVFPPLEDIIDLAKENTGQHVEVYPFRLPHDLRDKFAAATDVLGRRCTRGHLVLRARGPIQRSGGATTIEPGPRIRGVA